MLEAALVVVIAESLLSGREVDRVSLVLALGLGLFTLLTLPTSAVFPIILALTWLVVTTFRLVKGMR